MSRSNSPLLGRVIFVVGARRSGTNWLGRTLAAHPDVVALPSETYLFSHGIIPLGERFHHGSPGSPRTGETFMPRDAYLDAVRDLVDRVFLENMRRLDARATRVVERTPWHVSHLSEIADVYPDATFVHIVRDGRDVARSLTSMSWGPDTIEEAAEEWRACVVAGRRAARALGDRYVEVTYEQLLTQPREQVEALFDAVGLAYEDEVVGRAVAEARGEFNVDPRSPAVRAEKWRSELGSEQLAAFERIAGDLLEDLGYERAAARSTSPLVPRARTSARRAASGLRALASPRRSLQRTLDRAWDRRSLAELRRNHDLIRTFENAVANHRFEGLADLTRDDVRIELSLDGVVSQDRGRAGVRRLADVLEEHAAAVPLAGRVHPSPSMFTLFSRYELPDGSAWTRTLVVYVKSERISAIWLYRLQLGADYPSPA